MTTAVASPVTAYAEAVLSGEVLTGKMVRQACERHIRDLTTGAERGLYFDEGKANRAIRFFANLRLPDGNNAGKPFVLEPWQCFIVGSLFGWLRRDGKRRFQYAYVEVARANGKTPTGAGVLLYGLTADGENGAQCYSAATTRDQAKIAFRDATTMADGTPAIKSQVESLVNNLTYSPLSSFLRPLSADASKMDGLRVHVALADEVHEHPNGDVLAKLRTGMKSSQPLLLMITTAGYDRNSVCWEEHDYTVKVVEGIIEDDSRFGYIATLDEGDSWTDEKVWLKANPNLGVTVKLETLRQECASAKEIPGQQNQFRRLRLNQWTEQSTRWLDMETWDKGKAPIDIEALAGRICYGGLDLSSTTDLSAFDLLFPPIDDDPNWYVLSWFWLPEENIQKRVTRDRVPYAVWARQDFMELTDGNVIDYAWIRAKVNELSVTYRISEIGYDPWNATQLTTWLMEDGAEMVPVRQGFASLTAPTKEIEKLVAAGKLRHGGHPVLRWNASNVSVKEDPSGNIRIAKDVSTERIDGIAALANAFFCALRHESEESVYEDRGLLVL